MGDGPPTDGSKDVLKRMTEGIAERVAALNAVEKRELAVLTKLATTLAR